MASRRFSQFRKIKAEKVPELPSGKNLGNRELKETTGPFKPVEGGKGSGFNRGVNFPELKAYVKKSGI